LPVIQFAKLKYASILAFGKPIATTQYNSEVNMMKITAIVLASLCFSIPVLAQDEGHMDNAKEAAGEAWESTKEASGETWEATKEGSEKAWDATKEGSEKAWDATKEGSEKAWDATKEAVGTE
jgi:hypothetical protein